MGVRDGYGLWEARFPLRRTDFGVRDPKIRPLGGQIWRLGLKNDLGKVILGVPDTGFTPWERILALSEAKTRSILTIFGSKSGQISVVPAWKR